MKRRQFTVAGLGLLGTAAAQAQWRYAEGTHYVRLAQPVPVPPGGRIDVIEFFWYGCPHCHAFEPALEAWVKRLPPDVAFRRAHVAFTPMHEMHSRIYYALEQLGQVDALHRKVFAAIHQQRLALADENQIADFMAKNGVARERFVEVFRSPAVRDGVALGRRLSDAYRIDGVPALGVHGRYYTAGSLAGGNEKALQVVDLLVQQIRKGA